MVCDLAPSLALFAVVSQVTSVRQFHERLVETAPTYRALVAHRGRRLVECLQHRYMKRHVGSLAADGFLRTNCCTLTPKKESTLSKKITELIPKMLSELVM